ncbi:MAG: hypothetical protein GXO26_00690 [Crenarchaeota archaeon]|nr:hypothetical protein [Thermoproteota archaeon]
MTKQELMEEMRTDMLREEYETGMFEHKMRTEDDYFLETMADAYSDALEEMVEKINKDLATYGWETAYTAKDVINDILEGL